MNQMSPNHAFNSLLNSSGASTRQQFKQEPIQTHLMEQYEMFNESMNETSQSHTVYFQDSYCKLPGLILLYLLAAYCILSGLIVYAFKRDAAYIQASQCIFSGLMLYTFRPDSVYFQALQCILSSLIHSHTIYFQTSCCIH